MNANGNGRAVSRTFLLVVVAVAVTPTVGTLALVDRSESRMGARLAELREDFRQLRAEVRTLYDRPR